MRGKCFGCGSPGHTKKDGKHKKDLCRHCKKLGHCSLVCFSKYTGKPITAKATATNKVAAQPSKTNAKGKASVSATTPVPAKDSKGQADLLAQLIAQIKDQGAQIEALKSSF